MRKSLVMFVVIVVVSPALQKDGLTGRGARALSLPLVISTCAVTSGVKV